MSVAVAPDGRTAVSAGGEGDVLIWDLAHLGSGKKAGRLKGHEKVVEHVTISPDGRRVLSCGWDGSVRLWDLADQRQLARFPSPANVVAVAFSPDTRLEPGAVLPSRPSNVVAVARPPCARGRRGQARAPWELPVAPPPDAPSLPMIAPGAKP